MILMKNRADLLCSVNSALDTAVVCELTEFCQRFSLWYVRNMSGKYSNRSKILKFVNFFSNIADIF